MTTPIEESLPYDSPVPEETQPAWIVTVRILLPSVDLGGNPVNSQAAACDWMSEMLRGEVLDWAYLRNANYQPGEPVEKAFGYPRQITVSKPYVEGTFGAEED